MDKTLLPRTYGGTIRIPGSKSQTIRAVLIATFARGVSHIRGALESRDTLAAFRLSEALGAKLAFDAAHDQLTVDSTAFLPKDGTRIDCMNSGTTLNLAAGLLATLPVSVTLDGDGQLRRRPVAPLLDALRSLGAAIEGNGCPFTVRGPLTGGSCTISCPTSQYLSGLLLGCALAEGPSDIKVPLLYEKPYVGLTLAWLKEQGLEPEANADWSAWRLAGGGRFHPFDATVPGDWSSASFFLGLAAIGRTTITLQGLDADDIQGDRHILDVLQAMGCRVRVTDEGIALTGPQALEGGTFDLNAIPDTLPVLCAVATQAREDVTFTNVAQARIKETDRIRCMSEELAKLGAVITERPDGLTIHAGHPLHGGVVEGHGDHRIIMALSILSAVLPEPLTIKDCDAVDVTFPGFYPLLESLA